MDRFRFYGKSVKNGNQFQKIKKSWNGFPFFTDFLKSKSVQTVKYLILLCLLEGPVLHACYTEHFHASHILPYCVQKFLQMYRVYRV